MNELIFFGYIIAVTISSLIALKIGKEALIGLICVQAILVNLFVSKEIMLFGLTATASDALAVGTALSLNLTQEYFQKQAAQKAVLISFLCSLFYVIMTLFHLAYLPSATDASAIYFNALLQPMPRIVAASLIVYAIVQSIDCQLYGYACNILENRYFIFRNYGSLAITQLIDTILFSFLGLYGINEGFSSIKVIFEIIVISYLIKLITISIAAPFLGFVKRYIKTENR